MPEENCKSNRPYGVIYLLYSIEKCKKVKKQKKKHTQCSRDYASRAPPVSVATAVVGGRWTRRGELGAGIEVTNENEGEVKKKKTYHSVVTASVVGCWMMLVEYKES